MMMMIAVISIAPCLTRASTLRVTRARKRVHKTSTNYINIIFLTRAHWRTHARAGTHTHTHTHIYTRKHTHTYIYTHKHTHMYIYTHTHTYVHTHTHTYVHTHIHTHTKPHTHTYTFCLNKWWRMASPSLPPDFNLFRMFVCVYTWVRACVCVCVCVTVCMHVNACACESQCILAEERLHNNEKVNICCSVEHGNQIWSVDLLTPLTGLKRERSWN